MKGLWGSKRWAPAAHACPGLKRELQKQREQNSPPSAAGGPGFLFCRVTATGCSQASLHMSRWMQVSAALSIKVFLLLRWKSTLDLCMPRVEKPKNDLRLPEWHSQKGKWSLNFEGKQCDQDKMVGFIFIFFKKKTGGMSVRREEFRRLWRDKRPSVNIVAGKRRGGKVAERFRVPAAQKRGLKAERFWVYPAFSEGRWWWWWWWWGFELRCNKCSWAPRQHAWTRAAGEQRFCTLNSLDKKCTFTFFFFCLMQLTVREVSFLSSSLLLLFRLRLVCARRWGDVGGCGGAGGDDDDDGRSSTSSGGSSVTKLRRVAVSQLSMAADWIQTSPGLWYQQRRGGRRRRRRRGREVVVVRDPEVQEALGSLTARRIRDRIVKKKK